MKRALLPALIFILAGSACAIEIGDVRVGPTPTCDTTSRGILLLMAQAVPSAELIPCLEQVPDGWKLESAEIESDRAVLSLDGAGVGDVTVTLTPACNPVGRLIEDEGPPGAEVYERSEAGSRERRTVFPGGCVTVIAPDRLGAIEMTSEISFLTRQQLRALSDLDL